VALDNNELIGSMEPVCKGDADDLAFVSVDEGEVSCDTKCECTFCSSTSTTCNNSDDIKKIYYGISRDSFVLAEDIDFLDGRSPITP
jgi:hypothetical protein